MLGLSPFILIGGIFEAKAAKYLQSSQSEAYK